MNRGSMEELSILAIETSCDETAAAVVKNGREVISEALYSQIELHREYGGVVPEIASRSHITKLPGVVDYAVEKAGGFDAVDAIAVTNGPGLVGALLTGLQYAKGLAYVLGKPLIAVHHTAGHICANYLTHRELEPPFLCLVVSGGHTQIVLAEDYTTYRVLGQTRDDAAGEAIDKIARVLGLPYPGGPNLEKLAQQGDAKAFAFPQSFRGQDHLDFSFSGLKTAVINLLHGMEQRSEGYKPEDVAASFLDAVVSALVKNTFEAVRRTGVSKLAIAGGVAANAQLRQAVETRAQAEGVTLYMPEMKYCTDNAAMVASAAYYEYRKGNCAGFDVNALPVQSIEG